MDHDIQVMGISWSMLGNVREEIRAWKGISGGKKPVGLIPLLFFGLY